MPESMSAEQFVERLEAHRSAEEAKQDLIHRATGWALREGGKKDRPQLISFLDQHAATMPRTALRYAIEHLDKKQRGHYLGMKKVLSSSKPDTMPG